MKNIKRIQVDGKELCLRESGDTYRVVKPWKNEDGSINWFNIITGGSWWNLIGVIIIVALILGLLNEYSTNINILLDCFRTPTEACIEAFGNQSVVTLNPIKSYPLLP